MPHTKRKRYAVVSCHVERPLEDELWARFCAVQERRPGGFAIAALMRPADSAFGEDEHRWHDRARQAAELGPLGHHTHWTAPDHARPTESGAGERVLTEGRRLRELGLEPTLFCGGGWYTDTEVAEACAELGYVDCTPRASRPGYLGPNDAWARLAEPARLRLPSDVLLGAVPTTHSLGDLGRGLLRRSLPAFVHVYFHDTDLADRRIRAGLAALLVLLGRVAERADHSSLAAVVEAAPEIAWSTVAHTT